MRLHHVRFLVLAAAISMLGTGCSRERPAADEMTVAALRAVVAAKRPPLLDGHDTRHARRAWLEVQRFYKQNGYRLAWTDGRRARGAFDALLRAVHTADREGLDPADYRISELESAPRRGLTRDQAVALDVQATYAYLRYASDLARGAVDPEAITAQWHSASQNPDLHGALSAALAGDAIEQSLTALAPSSPQYQGLKRQLARARRRGDAAAVQQIAINMERWRWLPHSLGPRYVVVNIPAYRLDAIEDGQSVLRMKVVTGKKASPTPVLADEMTSIVFSPYWNIPQDIVDREIKPKLARDPEYLARNNIEADEESGRFRQRPGKGNSLGGVKFLFPNHFNVYLHDTPSQALFDRVERDFSHGCVRLDEPQKLAQYVLRDRPEWTPEKIAAAMQSGTEQAVKLKQPLPIYLVYFTAWEENGELETAPDVYGLDGRRGAAEERS
jgi:murein L,D-transpeptidase YcbB/YkuD